MRDLGNEKKKKLKPEAKSAKFCSSDPTVSKSKIKNLRPGDHFGEISLIFQCPCTATVRATKYSNVGNMSADKFKELLSLYPKIC